jgi:hypothetical protein
MLPINHDQREKMLGVLRMVQSDIQADVKRRDGQPFNGRNVSEALGEMYAQIDALANVLVHLLEDA